MNNPIIEKLQTSIQDKRTAEYFSEVLSCYYSGNLRSAVVMLYATVICDLIYKLEELRDIYNDTGARQILEDLERQQSSNPKSTDWEKDIPERCRNENKILTTADYSNFCSLQQLRHLCAHPVLGENKELYHPNSDIVLGHIRNMLEGVFVKPAFQTKALFDMFVEDLANIKDVLIKYDEINKYVEIKYLDKFNNIELEYYLFKNLWKFVFKLTDTNCETNRKINCLVLRILTERHRDILLEKFEKDREYFSRNIDESNFDLLKKLIKFFNIHPDFFGKLTKDKQIQIESIIENDIKHDFKSLALFKTDNIVNHIFNASFSRHKTGTYLFKYLYFMENVQTAFDYCIKLYASSLSFNEADWRFEDFIQPYIKEFSLNQLEEIVRAVNSNDQLYGRMKAVSSNKIVRHRILEMNNDFDFSIYPNFKY